ncbi:hypothetical protein [Streptacidiphilus neutrinimicus]|uniref:hypothetical protein n=1 Tax=Streptacidiphilus neutrinimicus TaxID=105420 RepID=UPI0005A832C2|nr:hypothetical protein [Streptacidiphilus neutrinimicus]
MPRRRSAVPEYLDRPAFQPTGRWTVLGRTRAWLEQSALADLLAARDQALASREQARLYRYTSGPRL